MAAKPRGLIRSFQLTSTALPTADRGCWARSLTANHHDFAEQRFVLRPRLPLPRTDRGAELIYDRGALRPRHGGRHLGQSRKSRGRGWERRNCYSEYLESARSRGDNVQVIKSR